MNDLQLIKAALSHPLATTAEIVRSVRRITRQQMRRKPQKGMSASVPPAPTGQRRP